MRVITIKLYTLDELKEHGEDGAVGEALEVYIDGNYKAWKDFEDTCEFTKDGKLWRGESYAEES